MNTKPLTQAETRWIRKAQQLFNDTPERFDFFTIGDAGLTIIDKAGAVHSEIGDGAAERDGIVLGCIKTKGQVHGVSG